MDYALGLKEISARLNDVANELTSMHEAFSDPEKKWEQKSFITSIRSTIVSFLSRTSKEIMAHSKILSPITGTDYVHCRMESKRKIEARMDELDQKKKGKKFIINEN